MPNHPQNLLETWLSQSLLGTRVSFECVDWLLAFPTGSPAAAHQTPRFPGCEIICVRHQNYRWFTRLQDNVHLHSFIIPAAISANADMTHRWRRPAAKRANLHSQNIKSSTGSYTPCCAWGNKSVSSPCINSKLIFV